MQCQIDGAKNQKVGLQSRDRRSFLFYRNVAEVSACNDKSAGQLIWAINMDDTPEQLWQRIVRENPRASDEEIEYLYLGAVIDLFKDMRKRLSN